VLGVGVVLRLLVAVAIILAIAFLGLSFLNAVSSARPKEKIKPEDVVELDVYFVCRECGTEYQVTRLGEVQVPRHCGEPMQVERRPRAARSGG
jgi:hypothetical protein